MRRWLACCSISFSRSAMAAASGPGPRRVHPDFQQPQFAVDVGNLPPHRPIVYRGHESHQRIEHSENWNQQDKETAQPSRHPERQIVLQERPPRLVELQRLAAQRKSIASAAGNCPACWKIPGPEWICTAALSSRYWIAAFSSLRHHQACRCSQPAPHQSTAVSWPGRRRRPAPSACSNKEATRRKRRHSCKLASSVRSSAKSRLTAGKSQETSNIAASISPLSSFSSAACGESGAVRHLPIDTAALEQSSDKHASRCLRDRSKPSARAGHRCRAGSALR